MRDAALYAQLLADLPAPHVAVTPDMVVFDANDAHLDMFGMTRDAVVGQIWAVIPKPRPGD